VWCSHEYPASPRRRCRSQGRQPSRPFRNPNFPRLRASEFPVRLRFLLRSRNIDSRRKKQRRGEGRVIESPNSNPHLAAPTGADRVPFDCPRRPGVLSSLPRMSTEAGELLGIDPLELRFPCMCLLPVGVCRPLRRGFLRFPWKSCR